MLIGFSPLGEIRIHGIPLGKSLGKHAPLAAALEKIQDGVEDLV